MFLKRERPKTSKPLSLNLDLLRHLEKQINGLREKRDNLEREMEQTVQMINRQSITQQARFTLFSYKILKKQKYFTRK